MRNRIVIVSLAICLLALVPAASANSVSYALSCGGTSCGTVKITDLKTGGVAVKVSMSGGYTIQASANNGFMFNTVSTLALTASDLSNFKTVDFGPVTGNLIPTVNGGAGKFTYGVVKFGIPNGFTSVTGISFNISGMTTADLKVNNKGNVVSVHYCTPLANGKANLNCPSPTGFASSTQIPSVPEPGTLSLLGTGLLGLAGVVRRRLLG